MAKPIFLIKCPSDVSPEHADQMMRKMQKKLADWHVLVARISTGEFEFVAFNADKLPDIDIEALKKELLPKE